MIGRVESVVRNPFYRPGPSGDVPGADNAVARVFIPAEPELLRALGTAEMSAVTVPEPGGRVLSVQVVDQFKVGRVVKAGNFTNPRWLEWGPSYRPVAGDSGSGVFVLKRFPDGQVRPILIGVVVDRGERGGGGSLLSREDAWVEAVLHPPDRKANPAPSASQTARPSERR